MERINEQIIAVLKQCGVEIQSAMAAKGINASGRTSKSIKVKQSASGIRLVLAGDDHAPLETLEIGRPSGRVPYNFTDIIYQWSLDKNLNWGDAKQRKKIAGAVAWGKIRVFGTNRHASPVEVYSEPTKKAKVELMSDIRIAVAAMIKSATINF